MCSWSPPEVAEKIDRIAASVADAYSFCLICLYPTLLDIESAENQHAKSENQKA
jgi:hypothetical protein